MYSKANLMTEFQLSNSLLYNTNNNLFQLYITENEHGLGKNNRPIMVDVNGGLTDYNTYHPEADEETGNQSNKCRRGLLKPTCSNDVCGNEDINVGIHRTIHNVSNIPVTAFMGNLESEKHECDKKVNHLKNENGQMPLETCEIDKLSACEQRRIDDGNTQLIRKDIHTPCSQGQKETDGTNVYNSCARNCNETITGKFESRKLDSSVLCEPPDSPIQDPNISSLTHSSRIRTCDIVNTSLSRSLELTVDQTETNAGLHYKADNNTNKITEVKSKQIGNLKLKCDKSKLGIPTVIKSKKLPNTSGKPINTTKVCQTESVLKSLVKCDKRKIPSLVSANNTSKSINKGLKFPNCDPGGNVQSNVKPIERDRTKLCSNKSGIIKTNTTIGKPSKVNYLKPKHKVENKQVSVNESTENLKRTPKVTVNKVCNTAKTGTPYKNNEQVSKSTTSPDFNLRNYTSPELVRRTIGLSSTHSSPDTYRRCTSRSRSSSSSRSTSLDNSLRRLSSRQGLNDSFSRSSDSSRSSSVENTYDRMAAIHKGKDPMNPRRSGSGQRSSGSSRAGSFDNASERVTAAQRKSLDRTKTSISKLVKSPDDKPKSAIPTSSIKNKPTNTSRLKAGNNTDKCSEEKNAVSNCRRIREVSRSVSRESSPALSADSMKSSCTIKSQSEKKGIQTFSKVKKDVPVQKLKYETMNKNIKTSETIQNRNDKPRLKCPSKCTTRNKTVIKTNSEESKTVSNSSGKLSDHLDRVSSEIEGKPFVDKLAQSKNEHCTKPTNISPVCSRRRVSETQEGSMLSIEDRGSSKSIQQTNIKCPSRASKIATAQGKSINTLVQKQTGKQTSTMLKRPETKCVSGSATRTNTILTGKSNLIASRNEKTKPCESLMQKPNRKQTNNANETIAVAGDEDKKSNKIIHKLQNNGIKTNHVNTKNPQGIILKSKDKIRRKSETKPTEDIPTNKNCATRMPTTIQSQKGESHKERGIIGNSKLRLPNYSKCVQRTASIAKTGVSKLTQRTDPVNTENTRVQNSGSREGFISDNLRDFTWGKNIKIMDVVENVDKTTNYDSLLINDIDKKTEKINTPPTHKKQPAQCNNQKEILSQLSSEKNTLTRVKGNYNTETDGTPSMNSSEVYECYEQNSNCKSVISSKYSPDMLECVTSDDIDISIKLSDNIDRCSNLEQNTNVCNTGLETQTEISKRDSLDHVKELSGIYEIKTFESVASCRQNLDINSCKDSNKQLSELDKSEIVVINDKMLEIERSVNIIPRKQRRISSDSLTSDDYYSMTDDDYDDESEDMTKMYTSNSIDIDSPLTATKGLIVSDSSDISEIFSTPLKDLSFQSLQELETGSEKLDKTGTFDTKTHQCQYDVHDYPENDVLLSNTTPPLNLSQIQDIRNTSTNARVQMHKTNDTSDDIKHTNEHITESRKPNKPEANLFDTKQKIISDANFESKLSTHESETAKRYMNVQVNKSKMNQEYCKSDKNQYGARDYREKMDVQANIGDGGDKLKMQINEYSTQGVYDSKLEQISGDEELKTEEPSRGIMDLESDLSSTNILTYQNNQDLLSPTGNITNTILQNSSGLLTLEGERDKWGEVVCLDRQKADNRCIGGEGCSQDTVTGYRPCNHDESTEGEKVIYTEPKCYSKKSSYDLESNYEADNLTNPICETCAVHAAVNENTNYEGEYGSHINKTTASLSTHTGELHSYNTDNDEWSSQSSDEKNISLEYSDDFNASENQKGYRDVTMATHRHKPDDKGETSNNMASPRGQVTRGQRCVKYEIVTTTITRHRRREAKIVGANSGIVSSSIARLQDKYMSSPSNKILNSKSVKTQSCKEIVSSDSKGQVYSAVKNQKNTEVIENASSNFDITDNTTANAFTAADVPLQSVEPLQWREAGGVGSNELQCPYRCTDSPLSLTADDLSNYSNSETASVTSSVDNYQEISFPDSSDGDSSVHLSTGYGSNYAIDHSDNNHTFTKESGIPSYVLSKHEKGRVSSVSGSKISVIKSRSNTTHTYNVRMRTSRSPKDRDGTLLSDVTSVVNVNSSDTDNQTEDEKRKVCCDSLNTSSTCNESQNICDKVKIFQDTDRVDVVAKEILNSHSDICIIPSSDIAQNSNSKIKTFITTDCDQIYQYENGLVPLNTKYEETKLAELVTNELSDDENKQTELHSSIHNNDNCILEQASESPTENQNFFVCENVSTNSDDENVVNVTLPIPIKINSMTIDNALLRAEVGFDQTKDTLDDLNSETENSVTFTLSMDVPDSPLMVADAQFTALIAENKPKVCDNIDQNVDEEYETQSMDLDEPPIVYKTGNEEIKQKSPKSSKKSTDRQSLRRHTATIYLSDRDGLEKIAPVKPRSRSKSPIDLRNFGHEANNDDNNTEIRTRRVSEICQSFIKSVRPSTVDEGPPSSPLTMSPSLGRKLKWIRDKGVWQRVTYEEYDRIMASRAREMKQPIEAEAAEPSEPCVTNETIKEPEVPSNVEVIPKFGAVLKCWQEAGLDGTIGVRRGSGGLLLNPKTPPKTLPKPKYRRTRNDSIDSNNSDVAYFNVVSNDTCIDSKADGIAHLNMTESENSTHAKKEIIQTEISTTLENKDVEMIPKSLTTNSTISFSCVESEGRDDTSKHRETVPKLQNIESVESNSSKVNTCSVSNSEIIDILPLDPLTEQSDLTCEDIAKNTEVTTDLCGPGIEKLNMCAEGKTQSGGPRSPNDDIPSIDGVEIKRDSHPSENKIQNISSYVAPETLLDKSTRSISENGINSDGNISCEQTNSFSAVHPFVPPFSSIGSPKKLRAVRIKQEMFPREPEPNQILKESDVSVKYSSTEPVKVNETFGGNISKVDNHVITTMKDDAEKYVNKDKELKLSANKDDHVRKTQSKNDSDNDKCSNVGLLNSSGSLESSQNETESKNIDQNDVNKIHSLLGSNDDENRKQTRVLYPARAITKGILPVPDHPLSVPATPERRQRKVSPFVVF